MPLYEYQCTKCKDKFEILRHFDDEPLLKCQKCGGKLVKLVSSSAIQFKGNGWYITDYAKKNSPPPSEKLKEGAGEKPAEARSDRAEKKPEAAKDAKDTPKPTPASSK